MIGVRCSSDSTIKLNELVPFQGDLKQRKPADVQALAKSLSSEGLLMPFAVWLHDGKHYLLDGHGRLAALTELMLLDPTIQMQDFPCLFITADTEDEAKKALLQITSQYGKVTKSGAVKFCASIPSYSAPSVNRFIHKPVSRRKAEQPANETILKISVQSDKIEEVKRIFAQVSYIKLLG